MKKRLWLPLLLILGLSSTVFAQNLTLPLSQLKTVDGELFLPLRPVAEFAGYTIQYQPQLITLKRSSEEIVINREHNTLHVNGHDLYLTTEPVLFGNQLYIDQGFVEDHLRLAIKQEPGQVSLAKVENQVTILNQKETFEDKYLEMKLQYPRLLGLEQGLEDKLNSRIQGKIKQVRADAHEAKEEFRVADWSMASNIGFYFDYQVKRNQGDLLSIVMEDYRYLGGAHGITEKSAYNFNLKTGQEYKLEDLFRPCFNYVALLNKEIEAQIAADNHKAEFYQFETIAKDQVFYLTNDALVICFQSYEIAAYAEGRPEFAIPFTAIAKDLAPAFSALLK